MKHSKSTVKKGVSPNPYLTSNKKLDQIRTGKVESQTISKESKDFVYKGKDGTKIISKLTQEKFEETAVLRKKRNYVMYESKLKTEKNTQIMKIEAPNSKPRIFRQPSPRIEEKIIITKKRKDYLDNYQYKESRVYRNPKKRRALVEHIRLGEIIDGSYETMTYQSQIIHKGDNHSRMKNDKSKDNMSKTFHQGFKDDQNERKNSRRSASSRSINNPKQEQRYTTSTVTVNRRSTSNILSNPNTNSNKITKIAPRNRQQIKSDVITNQIMYSRVTPKNQPEYQINTYNPRTRQPKQQPKKIENSIKKITKTVVKKDDNNLRNSNSKRRIEPPTKITSMTINKTTKLENNDNLRAKTPKVKEEINVNLRPKTPKVKEENNNNLRAKTPKVKEEINANLRPKTSKVKEEKNNNLRAKTPKVKEEINVNLRPKTPKVKEENNNNLRAKTPKKKEEKEETEIDFKHGKKTRKIIEVVNLDNKNKPKAIIEIVKYEKKEEKKPKKIIEVVKIEREEKKPIQKIEEEEKIEKHKGKKIVKRTEIIIENKDDKKEEIIFEKTEEKPIKSAAATIEVQDTIIQQGKKKSIRNKYKALH